MMLHDWTATTAQKIEALQGLTQKLQAASPANIPVLLPIGGDHLAPVSAAGYTLLKAQYPQLVETTPEHYLNDIQLPPAVDTAMETFSGELIDNTGSFLLPGVYSARMYLKQQNRHLEHLLTHKLEPLLALAQSLNLPQLLRYPTHELDMAWKTLILNHPHDSICGCSVDAVHRENEVRFEQVAQLVEAMLNRTQAALTTQLAGPEEWLILNTGETPYTGVIEAWEDAETAEQPNHLLQVEAVQTILQDEYLQDGHRIPLSHLTKTRRTGWLWAEAVPALGYQVLPKSTVALPPNIQPVQVESNQLQNELLSVQVEPNGTLTVTDLKTGNAYPHLLQFLAQPDQGDSYNSAPVPGSELYEITFQGYETQHTGPLVGSLTLTHTVTALNMTLTTEVQLQADSPLLRFETRFTNQTPNFKLQVGFATGEGIHTVIAENHLGLVTRQYDPDYREVDHMPVERMKELKTNTGPVQRFFSANGQSWITQGLAEYEVLGETMAITLLRAFGALSKADTGVRGAQAGPPFETPEGQCLHRVFGLDYAWRPTPETPQALYAEAARYYGNLWAQSGQRENSDDSTPLTKDNALAQVESTAAVISACYWIPEKGLVLRLLNPTDQPTTARLTSSIACQTVQTINFLEEPGQILWNSEGPKPTSPSLALPIEPYGVKTVLFAL